MIWPDRLCKHLQIPLTQPRILNIDLLGKELPDLGREFEQLSEAVPRESLPPIPCGSRSHYIRCLEYFSQ